MFVNKVVAYLTCAYLKTQMFSCKYCKIFKKKYFEEHLRTAACECIDPTKKFLWMNQDVDHQFKILITS